MLPLITLLLVTLTAVHEARSVHHKHQNYNCPMVDYMVILSGRT